MNRARSATRLFKSSWKLVSAQDVLAFSDSCSNSLDEMIATPYAKPFYQVLSLVIILSSHTVMIGLMCVRPEGIICLHPK